MIPLPPMPQLDDFPGHEYGYSHPMYTAALQAWERVCKDIIAANLQTNILFASIKKELDLHKSFV